jgi:hypothetical protein
MKAIKEKITLVYPIILIFYLVVLYSVTSPKVSIASTGTIDHSTIWVNANRSLAELLDSGWQIVSQSSHRAYYGGVGTGKIDESTYIYTLRKQSQYITCTIFDPIINQTRSRCRHIN